MAKIINPRAAGVDIAAKEHFVCVPHSNPKEMGVVRSFGSYTRDLHDLADWLQEHKITTVAMESTGIYWTELYFILKERGFEVLLVDARHIKNVPGRKSDVLDAQWIQKLHAYGFLRGCFQPENIVRTLRTLVRRRTKLIQDMTTSSNRMIKALEQMNLKTKQVMADIHGKTGQGVINAIIRGERNPKNFLQYKDCRIRATDADFILALEGNWKPEQLYLLELENNMYKFLKLQLENLDVKIEETLKEMIKEKALHEKSVRNIKGKNSPKFQVANYLKSIHGVDVTQIYGLRESGALTILSETGTELKKKFPTEKQFLSWLNLVPNNKVSGGKIISSGMKKKKNKAGQAFRSCASALWRSKNVLGEKLRSKKARKGAGPAIVSIAKTIASIYYHMITTKCEFDPSKLRENQNKQLIKKQNYYQRKALEMTLEIEKQRQVI